ncbi:claudin-18 [Paramormyrops kingsleyae]|uniref:claudin-18 n=2 Tax=Paramormyrops kingsleyae TaxID=1676925 RepID=UPI000CD6290A|nr:claudin-18 [Paramormyrops kingsleyae]
MAVTICQVMGFVLGVLGVIGAIVATALDQWSTEDLFDNPVTSVYSYWGLWRSCVRQSSGFTECRPYFTILGLPGLFQAVRALMIVGVVLAGIAALIAIFALKCIKMGGMEDTVKANLTLTSGIMFILSGICTIAGVSVFANFVVSSFMMTTFSTTEFGGMGSMAGMGIGGIGAPLTPRYTFGPALFVGWVAGGILTVGGVMMCVACKGLQPEKSQFHAVSYKAPSHNTIYKSEDRQRQIYNDSYKARSEDGRRSNMKYDYV